MKAFFAIAAFLALASAIIKTLYDIVKDEGDWFIFVCLVIFLVCGLGLILSIILNIL